MHFNVDEQKCKHCKHAKTCSYINTKGGGEAYPGPPFPSLEGV